MRLTDQLILEAKNLSFKYLEQNKRNVLDHINISFEAGKIHVLMGSSGSGKSTLAALLAGLYPENAGLIVDGCVRLAGRNITEYSLADRAGLISMMFQNADLQFCMETLREEMAFCLENISCPPKEMPARIKEAAEKMEMTEFLDRKLTSLSGGEKQKAALTCIFLLGSKIILLDEPFANIDAAWAPKLIDMLDILNKTQGTTIIAIEHVLDEWMDKTDYIHILEKNGTVHSNIRPEELPSYKELFAQEGLRWPWDEAVRKTKNKGGKKAVLTLKNICVSAGKKKRRPGGKEVLTHADAVFYEDEMTAVQGPSGCGKTTLFRTMLGQQAYEGSIYFENEELRTLKGGRLFSKIGIVFQNPSNQFMTQNVLEEIETGLSGKMVKRKNLEGSDTEKQALALLSEFHLEKYRNYSPYMLSQGQQRRLAVLAVLAGPQKILLLDEPTYGQDDAMTREIMELLKKRMEETSMTVIFSSHDQRLVRHWADRRYVFREGELFDESNGED